eukprot:6189746-Pleurochrysis_carterae.AAC.1
MRQLYGRHSREPRLLAGHARLKQGLGQSSPSLSLLVFPNFLFPLATCISLGSCRSLEGCVTGYSIAHLSGTPPQPNVPGLTAHAAWEKVESETSGCWRTDIHRTCQQQLRPARVSLRTTRTVLKSLLASCFPFISDQQ